MNNRMITLILALLLLSGCTMKGKTEQAEKAPASTEPGTELILAVEPSEEETPLPETGEPETAEESAETGFTAYRDTEPHIFDLLGDGSSYVVQLTERVMDEFGNLSRDLTVTDPRGASLNWESGTEKALFAVADLDDDGRSELLFWYDEASDDFVTMVFSLDGGFRTLAFASSQGDSLTGIGGVENVENGVVTMGAFQYVLGTYGAERGFYLADDGKMHPLPDSMWTFRRNEQWLTTKTELSAALSDSTSTLAAGSHIRLLGWNGSSQVFFETEDGRSGTLSVSRAEVGWQVGGIGEHDAFEALPYAG